jgi:hypothetical protein
MTSQATDYRWVAIQGKFSHDHEVGAIVFHGEELRRADNGELFVDQNGLPYSTIGSYMSDQTMAEGVIEAVITFTAMNPYTACDFVLYHDPASGFQVNAGLTSVGAFSVRYWDTQQWLVHVAKGERQNIQLGVPYHLWIERIATTVTMKVNGVVVLKTNLPWHLPQSQVGLWCLSSSQVEISEFRVTRQSPRAFVVMQFSEPFNSLFQDVIVPICMRNRVEAHRADDTVGPGVILQDIVNQLEKSTFIIADITAPNPNVFWEVGYAHALKRDTILLADRDTKLPFDLSGFRALFYENSIAGKRLFEEGLDRYIQAIMKPPTP